MKSIRQLAIEQLTEKWTKEARRLRHEADAADNRIERCAYNATATKCEDMVADLLSLSHVSDQGSAPSILLL